MLVMLIEVQQCFSLTESWTTSPKLMKTTAPAIVVVVALYVHNVEKVAGFALTSDVVQK